MTTTTERPTWMPVLVFGRSDENCARCGGILGDNYLATIAIGVNEGGPACQECVDQLGELGRGLWLLAQGLTDIDSAMCELPQDLRKIMTGVAGEVLQKILGWRMGPITDEEKIAYVAEMAAEDKLLRLPGSRAVKATEYDPETHGPFLP